MKRHKQPGRPAISETEKASLRAVKLVGQEHAITKDEYGRDRIKPLAISDRTYEVGGHTTIVRVRTADPLQAIANLSRHQREAGQKYREYYLACLSEGIKPQSMEKGVDGSRGGLSPPERLAEAAEALYASNSTLGYPQVIRVMELVCGHGWSLSAIAKVDGHNGIIHGVARESLSVLLSMGLDKLALLYGITAPQRRNAR